MTYLERITAAPLTAKQKRRALQDAERLRSKGARQMLRRAIEQQRQEQCEGVELVFSRDLYAGPSADRRVKFKTKIYPDRSMAVSTWMVQS